MTKGADLYHLQRLDREGDTARHRLAEVEGALGESEALKQARRALQSAQALVQKQTVRQRDLELETQGLSDKISGSEKRLYSGEVKNPKALADLQAEIASLRRRRQKLEDDLLGAMIELEETRAAHTGAHERLDEMQAHWSAQQADLLAEREALRGRLAEVEQARAELVPHVAAGDLATYQALRRRKGGLAVVEVRDGACGGCGIAISPSLNWQLRQDGIGHCANCERILVRV